MAFQPDLNPVQKASPTPIEFGAAENLRYIRNTIAAAHTFTTVSGKGCVAMGAIALLAAILESIPWLQAHWLTIWLMAAGLACSSALVFMQIKARSQGLSLLTSMARKFFMSFVPVFGAGCILTIALVPVVSRDVIAGIWLLLYGAGLAACGVFSLPAVLLSGFLFMILGTVALWAPSEWAVVLLSVGFGGVHFLLGTIVWRNHGG